MFKADRSLRFPRDGRGLSGEHARLGRWFRRLAGTVFLKFRESETLSPTPETGALPRFNWGIAGLPEHQVCCTPVDAKQIPGGEPT